MYSKGESQTGVQSLERIKRNLLLMARIDSTRLFELVSSTTRGGKNFSWRRGQAPQECGWNLNSDETDIFNTLHAKFSLDY